MMTEEKKTFRPNSQKAVRINSVLTSNTWAAIASSIAAVVSMILLFYQLYTDNPNLQLKLAGAAYIDFEEYEELYIPVWITAFNKGKRPIGILEANLEIKFPQKTIVIEETPIFPRYHIKDKTNPPQVESPFFFDPSYYNNSIKGGEQWDLHPKSLEFRPREFEVGTYQRGYIVFVVTKKDRLEVIKDLQKVSFSLKIYTTDEDVFVSIDSLNKWEKDTFRKRFLLLK